MPLAVIPDPERGTIEIQVEVTGVEPDGRFHIKGTDGFAMGWCSPEMVQLYEDGVRVAASVPPPPAQMTDDMLVALQILLGGDGGG